MISLHEARSSGLAFSMRSIRLIQAVLGESPPGMQTRSKSSCSARLCRAVIWEAWPSKAS